MMAFIRNTIVSVRMFDTVDDGRWNAICSFELPN